MHIMFNKLFIKLNSLFIKWNLKLFFVTILVLNNNANSNNYLQYKTIALLDLLKKKLLKTEHFII